MQACIKDVYNAMNVVDLTSPEFAVKEVISNISRAFRNGTYLTTVRNMLFIMRASLINWYKIKDSMIDEICTFLNVKEYALPYQLGFVPTNNIVQMMIYGADIQMFDINNSKEVDTFYRKLHSATMMEMDEVDENRTLFDDYITGKFKMVLPLRLDKRMTELKNNFFQGEMEREKVREEMEKYSLMTETCNHLSSVSMKKINSYLMDVSRKYEFGETMAVQSLVRALQLTGTGGFIHPLDSKELNDGSSFKNQQKKYSLYEFIKFIMSVDIKVNSINSMDFMTGFKNIMKETNRMEEATSSMMKKAVSRHSKMRTLKFFTSEHLTSFSETEIIRILFSEKQNFGHSKMLVISAISRMLGVDLLISKDVVQTIKDVFNKSFNPMMSFVNLLKNNRKTMRMEDMEMVTDSIDYGSSVLNIKELYKTRSVPGYIYVESNEKGKDNSLELRMMTMMTLRKEDELMEMSRTVSMESQSPYKIMMDDNNNLVSCKLINSFIVNKDNRIMSKMRSDKTFFKTEFKKEGNEKMKYMYYTEVDNTAILEIDLIKKTMMAYLSIRNELAFEKSNLLRLFRRDIHNYENENFKLFWKHRKNKINKHDMDFYYDKANTTSITVKLVPTRLKWMVVMVISGFKFSWEQVIMSSSYAMDYSSFKFLMKNMSTDYMSLIQSRTITIMQVNKMFMELGWVKDDREMMDIANNNTTKVYTTRETLEQISEQTTSASDMEPTALMLNMDMSLEDFEFDDTDAFGMGEDEEYVEEDLNTFSTNDMLTMNMDKMNDIMSGDTEEMTEEEMFDGKPLLLNKLMDRIISVAIEGTLTINYSSIKWYANLNPARVGSMLMSALRFVLEDYNLTFRIVEIIFFNIYKKVLMQAKVPYSFEVKFVTMNEISIGMQLFPDNDKLWPITKVMETRMSTTMMDYF
jgi:hypothetical protein